jgi:four helix bundle protein
MDLVLGTYDITGSMPSTERFVLVAQMRRAAVSIPSNVAEGHAFRSSRKTYRRFVRTALGSLAELDTQLEVAERLRLVDTGKLPGVRSSLVRAGQLLHGLLRALNRERGGSVVR